MADYIPIIISLISGLIGGNLTGAAAPEKSLGGLGNSIAGLLGGGLGGYLLEALNLIQHAGTGTGTPPGAAAAPGAALDIGTILASIGSGGISGAILTFIAGLIKNSMRKSP